MSLIPNLDNIRVDDYNSNFIKYNNKYRNIVFIIKNKNESEIFLKYIQPYVKYDLIITCDNIIEMANSSNEYPIYIRFYYYDNKLHRSWDSVDVLNTFVEKSSYEKIFYIKDLINGVLYNILLYGKSYHSPTYTSKERPKRILESIEKDIHKIVFFIKNEEESNKIQRILFNHDYEWGYGKKTIKIFNSSYYPLLLFINFKDNGITYLSSEDYDIKNDSIEIVKNMPLLGVYKKIFDMDSLGEYMNILINKKTSPTYTPKERPKRLLESNNSDYTSVVFQVNNEYENEIAQTNILKNGYVWSSINKNIRKFTEYPTYIFIEIKEKVINYTTDSVLKTSSYEDIHNYIKYCNDNGENIIPKIFTYNNTNYINDIIKNGDIVPLYKPKKNKRILENKLNEIADYIKIDNKELRYYDDDAYAFLYLDGYENNTFIIKQGLSHVDLIGEYLYNIKDNEYMDVYYTEDAYDYLYSILDGCEFKGRLWLNSKVMGFWDLSCNDNDIEIFKKLIKEIEKKLNIKINPKEWKVEFFDIEKQTTFFVTIDDFINKNINVGDSKTSKEDFEKLKKQHFDNNKKDVPYGFGSKNPKYKSLQWRQSLYAEKINNIALNEYDFDAIIIDVKNKNDRDKFLNFIINIEEVYNHDVMLYKTSKYFIIVFNNRGYNIRTNILHYINDDTNTFIENEEYKDYYPQIKHSKPYNVDDAIDIISQIFNLPIARYMYKPKGKNKRLLENKLNEDCDFVTLPNGNKLSYTDKDAYPFFYIDNKFMVGDAGDNHTNLLSDYLYSINDYSDDKLYKYYHNECLFKGRYWLNSKVISFWEYINPKDLSGVLKDLEKYLKIKIDTDKWLLDYYVNNDFDYDSSKNLVPISEYLVGNFEDHTDDVYYQRKKEDHFKSPLLKKKYTPKGFGSKSSKYKPLEWRQALYTENFKFDKLPYNMFVFKIGDVDIDYVKNSLKKLGVNINSQMDIIPNSNKPYMFFTSSNVFVNFLLYTPVSNSFSLDDFLFNYEYKSTNIFNSYYEFERFIEKKLYPTYEPKKNKRLLENIKNDKILNSKYDVFVFKIDPSDNIKDVENFLEKNGIIYNHINFVDRYHKNYIFLTKTVNNNKEMMLLHCYDDNFTLIKDFINVNNLESSPFFTTFAKLKKFIDKLQLVSSDMYKPKVMNKRILERIEAQMDIPQDIHDFYDLFEKSGKKLYLVGGCVRDYLMGKKPHDFDMVTNAQPDEVVNILKDYRTDIHGAHFGVVRVYTESEPQGYEIASYRKDISKGRNTKGNDKKVETGRHITIKDDVNRRDLTINALFYNIKTGEIIDTVGGMKDIKDNIIKAVGNPLKRFDEDRLRILRTLRFAAVTGGKIDKETSKAILQDNRLFGISEEDDVSIERIFAEFLKVKEKSRKNADGDIITRFINLLIDYDIMSQIFPVLVTEKNIVSTQYLTVALAQCLRQNRINDEFKQTLIDAKIPTSYVNIISTLIKIFRNGVDENNVYNLYREIKSNGVRLDILREWIKVMRINDKRVIALLKYEPSTTGHEVMKDGFKKEEIGLEISRREAEKFKELLKTI